MAFIGRNLNRFFNGFLVCDGTAATAVVAPRLAVAARRRTAPWWARWAPRTTPRRRPRTATDCHSRMKHESPPCAHIPTDGPTEKQHGRHNTTATADTSTGSTRKEHGASYPRPLPRSLCGVRSPAAHCEGRERRRRGQMWHRKKRDGRSEKYLPWCCGVKRRRFDASLPRG